MVIWSPGRECEWGREREFFPEPLSEIESVVLQRDFAMSLLSVEDVDEVFKSVLNLYTRNSFGGAYCASCWVFDEDEDSVLKGRYSSDLKREVDDVYFCKRVAAPVFDRMENWGTVRFYGVGCGEGRIPLDEFGRGLRSEVPGLMFMGVPLLFGNGEDSVGASGSILFYKRGEQPFSRRERDLAQVVSFPAGIKLWDILSRAETSGDDSVDYCG